MSATKDKNPPAEGAAETASKHESKTLAECDEVVVTVGPRRSLVDGEVVEVEKARTGIFKRAWWEGLYRIKGKPVQFPAKLEGYPVYTDEAKTEYEIGPIDEKATAEPAD